jgi:GT2 family glycosyltransferase
MPLSLIIITQDKLAHLKLTLMSCAAHVQPAADEIIVVDDGNSIQARFAVDDWVPSIPVLFVEGPRRGRAAARNAGAARAVSPLLVFLDDDILTAPDFLSRHAEMQRSRGGLVRGRIRELIGAAVCPNFSLGGPGFPAIAPSSLLAVGFNPKGYRVAINRLEQAIEARFVTGETQFPAWLASAGANFSISKSLWDEFGGEDERFGQQWGCEDLEFTFRLDKQNAPISFSPEATGYHLSHSQPNRWRQHANTLEIFRSIHPGFDESILEALFGQS